MILKRPDGTLSLISTVVPRRDILNSDAGDVVVAITLQKVGGFVVKALKGRGDSVTLKEISTAGVSSDKVGLATAIEGFQMDVIATNHDENILRAALRLDGKTAG